MWNMKCMTPSVITEANGTVTKCLKKNLEAISSKHSIDSLQTKDSSAIHGTLHRIWEVLQSEWWGKYQEEKV